MQKRHRRSIRPETEMTQNDDANKKQQQGVSYPNLFEDQDGNDFGQGKRLYPDPNINRSWPTSSGKISTMEEQEEEEDEFDEREEDEEEEFPAKPRKRRGRPPTRRSLPPDTKPRLPSRSRSGQRQQRKTPSPILENGEDSPWAYIKDFYESTFRNWGQHQIQNYQLAVCVFIVICFFFLMCFGAIYMSWKQLTPEQQFSQFRKELKGVVDREVNSPAENQEAKSLLLYITDRMLKREHQYGNEQGNGLPPMTLLIASNDIARADQIADLYCKTIQENWPNFRLLNHTFTATSSRLELEQNVLGPILAEHRNHRHNLLLLLQGIGRLQGNAPLFLHSLADPESSPVLATPHNLLIIGTLQAHNEQKAINCAETIESSLVASWKSKTLAEDQIHPIISRIGAHSICV